jgi:hypothetical protein
LKLDGLLVVVELLQSDEEFGEDVVNAWWWVFNVLTNKSFLNLDDGE